MLKVYVLEPRPSLPCLIQFVFLENGTEFSGTRFLWVLIHVLLVGHFLVLLAFLSLFWLSHSTRKIYCQGLQSRRHNSNKRHAL